jgi:hypothetical protein
MRTLRWILTLFGATMTGGTIQDRRHGFPAPVLGAEWLAYLRLARV